MKWIKKKSSNKFSKDKSIVELVSEIRNIEDSERFFNPTSSELHNPYLMKNIEKACQRVLRALENNERILASYDADGDGITSTTVLIRNLKKYTDNIDYIYNERTHGHGIYEQTRLNFVTENDLDEDGNIVDEDKKYRYELNKKNLEKIKDSDLLIIVDSSSNDTEACLELVENYGIDIIILDHHDIDNHNPHVLLVNPKQEGCEYPNKELSGAGVVFKFTQVLDDYMGTHSKVNPFDYIDLVAVGMYADVMRLDNYENRFIIMHGLRNVKNVGLVRILKGAKADLFKLNGDSIGFSIAPLLNGVARLGNIKLAIDILLTDDDNEAKKLRLQMHKLNEKRKEMQKEIADRYAESINLDEKILTVMDDNSSKGFNGLIAQELAQRYKRPVLVGRLHNGTYSGSFRSYGGFSVKDFLLESNLVEESAGHAPAGGFKILEENIDNLKKHIELSMPELSEKEEYAFYDLEIDFDDIEDSLIKEVEKVNLITGNGFREVTVRVNNVSVSEVKTLGRLNNTRKILTMGDLELIKFRVDERYADELEYFDEIDVLGKLSNNEWFNFKTREKVIVPQVMILDYIKK